MILESRAGSRYKSRFVEMGRKSCEFEAIVRSLGNMEQAISVRCVQLY